MNVVWSERRSARLGYLVGIGWDAARIAADPAIRATPSQVHARVVELGLCFRGTVSGTPLNLDGTRMAYFDAAARPRRLPTEALLRKLCETIADDRRLDEFVGLPSGQRLRA